MVFLLGSSLSVCVGAYGFVSVAEGWGEGDFDALKSALVISSAIYIISGMLRPQLELPTLQRLREIRRQFGFGRITGLEAIERSEEVLIGHRSAKFLTRICSDLMDSRSDLTNFVDQIEERVSVLKKIEAPSGDDMEASERIITGEAVIQGLYSLICQFREEYRLFTEDHQSLVKTEESFRSATDNDFSLREIEVARKQVLSDVVDLHRRYLEGLSGCLVCVKTLRANAKSCGREISDGGLTAMKRLKYISSLENKSALEI